MTKIKTAIQNNREALLTFAQFFTLATAIVALCVFTVVLAFQVALGSGTSDPMPAFIAIWSVIGMAAAFAIAGLR